MKTTDFTFNGQSISYDLKDNGYVILLDGKPWIEQLDTPSGQFGKPMDKNMSYEENCLAQIEELCAVREDASVGATDNSTLQAQVEYLAMMSGVDLTEASVTE